MSGFGSGKILPGKKPSDPIVQPVIPDVIKTPWASWFDDRLGWTEFDHDKELSKGWHYCGLNYTTVIGSDHAWCAMSLNTALIENGYLGTGSAAAKSFEHYGTPCGYVYGAIIPIRHKDGNHHVTLFHSWYDEKGRIAKCIGGNQQNAISIAHYDLTGNQFGRDECPFGPRWPSKKPA